MGRMGMATSSSCGQTRRAARPATGYPVKPRDAKPHALDDANRYRIMLAMPTRSHMGMHRVCVVAGISGVHPLEIPTASVATMYETALTIRLFEQRAIEQYRVGNIRGYLHPYLGEEGIAVGASRPCGRRTTS